MALVMFYDTNGKPQPVDVTDGAVHVMDERLQFNSGKLEVEASVTLGEITIENTHITDASNSTQANVITNGVHNGLVVVQDSQPLPTGAATSSNQTSGSQKTQINDAHGHLVNVQAIADAMAGDEYGLISNSIIHGKTTAGGGAFVDVKVTPSGALSTDTTVSSSVLPTGASTSANQTNGSQKVQLTDATGNLLVYGDRVQTPTGKVIQVQIGPGDKISSIPVVMDYPHHQIHEGETWKYQSFGTLNASTRDIRISVPALTPTVATPHLFLELISDNTTATMWLYEGTTFTSGGTDDSANIRNRNRNVAGSPGTKVYIAGGTALTPNALGTILDINYLFTNKAATNIERGSAEWDLKASTEYLVRVTTTGNGTCLLKLHWYEDLGV